jgi:hypothetical protein
MTYTTLLLASAVFLAARCNADVIYTDFGTNQSFDTSQGWNITGTTSGLGYTAIAMPFTSGGNFTLAQIDVAIGWFSASTTSVIVDLETDSSGLPSGSILESWTLTGLPHDNTSFVPETLHSIGTPLHSGVTYWIAALPGAADTGAGWQENNQAVTVTLARDSGTGWHSGPSTAGAFDVVATPETSQLLLCMFGLAAIGAGRARLPHRLARKQERTKK